MYKHSTSYKHHCGWTVTVVDCVSVVAVVGVVAVVAVVGVAAVAAVVAVVAVVTVVAVVAVEVPLRWASKERANKRWADGEEGPKGRQLSCEMDIVVFCGLCLIFSFIYFFLFLKC